MAEVSAQAHIAAPAGEVWARLTGFGSYGRWNSTRTGFPHGAPANLAAGSSFIENMRLIGFPAEVTWTVAVHEPERALELTGKGPMGVDLRMRYRLDPEGTGIRAALAPCQPMRSPVPRWP